MTVTTVEVSPDTRHDKMVAAAVWLAGQRFADIGWAPTSDGKAPVRRWKSDATDDPALVPDRLHGARNALVIPKGHGLVIDADDPRAWPELEAAGLPETFRIDSPTPGHGHAYAWADADMATIPGSFEWGEIRRSSTELRTSSMVLGPYALRPDGVYEPHNGCRTIATLPDSVVEYLRESSRQKSQSYAAAQSPADPGWYIEHGRHEWLVNRARKLRGDSLSGERLYDELVRIDQTRHRPPLADTGRGIEIRQIADWANLHIEEDPPGVTINTTPKAPSTGQVGIDAAELLELTLEPLREIVPRLIPEGTTVLAAPPKVGKSCLVYQIVVEVAIGGDLFGQRVTPGSCLYLALEDGRRRGQDRLRAALEGRTLPRGRLEIRWSSRRIGEGLEEDLAATRGSIIARVGYPGHLTVALRCRSRTRPGGRCKTVHVEYPEAGPAVGAYTPVVGPFDIQEAEMTMATDAATYAGSIANAELGPGGSMREELDGLIVHTIVRVMDALDGQVPGDEGAGAFLDDDEFDRLRGEITGTIVDHIYQATERYVGRPRAVAS